MNLKKYLKYLIIPIVVVLLAVPLVLTGCSQGSADAETVQTPFDLLKSRVSSVEGKISQVEADLADVDLDGLEAIGDEFPTLTAQFDDLVLAFGVLQGSLDSLIDDLDALTLQVGDIEQGGNETATGLALLVIALADLATRVEQLEQDGPGESALVLIPIGSLPDIVNSEQEYSFTVYVENTGTSAASGQIVLQLHARSGSAIITDVSTLGSPFVPFTITYIDSEFSCSKIVIVSNPITLAGGQGKTYQFRITLEQDPIKFWWIPTLEIAN